MYNLHLSPEQLEFRDTVRDFVEDEVKPVTLKADRLDLSDRTLPVEVLRKASQMGLRTLALPEDLGGVGADALTCLHRHRGACGRRHRRRRGAGGDVGARAASVRRDDAGAARALRRGVPGGRRLSPGAGLPRARRRQRARHQLPPPRRRRCASPPPRPATATTGSSTAPRTASPTRPIAKLIAVEAQTDKGAALFLVPRDTPGLTVTEQPEPRWYHGSCGQLSLKDVRVPAGNLLGISGASDAGRAAPLAQALNLGIGRAAYEAALEYAGLRVQGGRRIVEHQAIGTKLAEIAIRLDIARTAIWRAAWACRPSRTPLPTAACPTCRSPPSPRCSPPRRSIAPRKTPPNASAPWA